MFLGGGTSYNENPDASAEIENTENPAAAEGAGVEGSASEQQDDNGDEDNRDEGIIPLINDLIQKAAGSESAESGAEDTELTLADSGRMLRARAVDITFRSAGGRKIEPAKTVRVRISADVIADSEDNPTIVHVKNNGRTEIVAPAEEGEQSARSAGDEVVFDADQFSVYAVIYTVDFANGENIYHLKGNSSVHLSEILKQLKIKSGASGHILTAEDVTDVYFSDEALVSISKENSDWILTAEEPFDTEETLTLTLKTGETVTVQVTDDNTDFGQYIRDVVVEKKVGDGWVPMNQFNDGDTVRIRLGYNLPAGVITAEKKTVTYQLPGGIDPAQAESGDITQNGKKVGTYTIDTDGLVSLTFDDEFASDGKGIDGTIRFQGTVSNTSGGSSGTITFPGNTSITVITPQQDSYDISTVKEGSVNADHTKASYKVTVSTQNGTGDTVTVADQFSSDQSSNAQFRYDQSSLQIVRISSNGGRAQVSSGYSVTWTTADNSDPRFEITGLPALNAGEKYEITYDANISVSSSDKTTIVNQAYSRSGNHDNWAWNSEEIHSALEKTGIYDPKTNTFSWTLWLNNGNGADVSSWQITDQTSYPIAGSVTVYCRSKTSGDIYVGSVNCTGETQFDISLSSLENFSSLTDDQKKDTFYVVYSTQAPEGKPGETVSETNQAWCTPGSGGSFYTETTAEGALRDLDVSKQFNQQDSTSADSDGRVYEYWSANVTLPVGSLTSFIYTDEIEQVLDDENRDRHYATAKDLEKYFTQEENPTGNRSTGLFLKLGEYDRYNYNGAGKATTKSSYYSEDKAQSDISISVTYYDAAGHTVQAGDDETPVKKFSVTVTPQSGSTITAQSLVLKNYRTVLDTKTQKDGQEWLIKNKATVGNKSSEAQTTYKKPYSFDKQVYTGSTNGMAVFKDGNQEVPYRWTSEEGLQDGQVKYRLLLHTTKTDQGTLTITDTLPAGMTLVDGSVYAKFFVDEYTQYDKNWTDPGTDFTGSSKPSVHSQANDDGTTTLTIIISDYYWSSALPNVAVYYTVALSPEDWSDLNTTEKSYKNTASWNGHSSEDNVKVTREKTILGKSGVQLDKNGNPVELDDNGKPKIDPTGTLSYSVVINAGAEDLVPNADTMTLTDTLSGAANYNPQLDLDSVGLYQYDPVRPDHLGAKLDDRTYMFKYDALNSRITLTLPDSQALVFVYKYVLEDNYAGGVQISNNASLNGEWSTTGEIKLVETSSSATAEKKKILLYKVDSQNYRQVLPGTEFTLERYDGNKIWTRVNQQGREDSTAVLTVDSEGKIEWDLSGQNPPIQADKLYRLTETKARDGYQLDSTHHYFIWRDQNSSNDDAYSNSQAGNQADDAGTGAVPKDKISIFPYAGGVMYIENKYTRIAVEKVWQNADGTEGTIPKDAEVKVQLQRQTAKPDGYAITVREVAKKNPDNQKVFAPQYVAQNSAIKVMLLDWNNETEETQISYDGKIYTMNREGDYLVYTIEKVTKDLDVQIETPEWNKDWNVTFEDYTSAPIIYSVQDVNDPVALEMDKTEQQEYGGGLYYVWDNLPQTDSEGKPYYYTVKEVNVTQDGKDISGNYKVSYTNNGGIQSGLITISNTAVDSGVVLPSTGGAGARRYIGMGVALFAAAAFLYSIKHIIHQRREVFRS